MTLVHLQLIAFECDYYDSITAGHKRAIDWKQQQKRVVRKKKITGGVVIPSQQLTDDLKTSDLELI